MRMPAGTMTAAGILIAAVATTAAAAGQTTEAEETVSVRNSEITLQTHTDCAAARRGRIMQANRQRARIVVFRNVWV